MYSFPVLRANESCSCGATFSLEATSESKLLQAVRDWRADHTHRIQRGVSKHTIHRIVLRSHGVRARGLKPRRTDLPFAA